MNFDMMPSMTCIESFFIFNYASCIANLLPLFIRTIAGFLILSCLWEHALKRSLGIIRKSRVSYSGPGFLSSATWSSLPKKHYNVLINQSTISAFEIIKNVSA